jgi:hypothetical protein
MTCEACGREHRITGHVEVDGVPLLTAFQEIAVEIACRHGSSAGSSRAMNWSSRIHRDPETRRARRGALRRAPFLPVPLVWLLR